MKRWIALLLAGAMVLALAACGAPPAGQAPPPPAGAAETEPVSGEVARALALGLVPEELQGDYQAPIAFDAYCRMLTGLIARWDDSRLEEWEAVLARAAGSGAEMRREDGILATAYALVFMGVDSPEDRPHRDIDPVLEQLDSGRDTPSWDYPLFPGWEEEAFGWCGGSYLWGGLITCAVLISPVSGEAIYPYDFEGQSAHLQDPLTREEAICAVLRLGETDPAILEPEGVYRPLSEVGGWDPAVLSLPEGDAGLPEVTQAHLPSGWKGAGLSSSKNTGSGAMHSDFRETDLKFLADNGFNFARIFLSLSSLRFPDYPADPRLVNENELRDLDQLLAWGMEYGVHIQLSMSFYLDETGGDRADGSMPAGDGEWALVRDYWTMLARRYAGIPSRYLTFDLSNELQPRDGEDRDYAAAQLGELVASVRGADPERVLLCSFEANPDPAWVETAAALGVAIGCHPYYPSYIATTGYEYAEQNPYARPVWPLPWFPMGRVQDGAAPLVLEGALSGAALSIHVEDGTEGTEIAVTAQGEPVETIRLSGGVPAGEEGVWRYERIYEMTLPQGTTRAEIRVSPGGYAKLDTLLVGETVLVPHDIADYPDRSDPLPLVLREDGSYTNREDRYVDGAEIYRVEVQPWQELARRYGVGFMVNEFGVFGANVDWDNATVAAYHDTVLGMLTDQEIGWCCCELYNPVPNHLVLMPAGGASAFQWQGATLDPEPVSCASGARWTYQVNRELMEVFRRYTRPSG